MSRKSKVTVLLVLLVFAFIQVGCTQQDAHSEEKQKNGSETSADTTNAQEQPMEDEEKKEDLIPVETTKLKAGEISAYILLSSNLETEGMADVYTRVQGIVEEIHAEVGEHVNKGEVLATLEADEHELTKDKALVDYRLQKSSFERSKQMHEKELLSNEEFEQAKFNLEAAEIAYKQAKLNLDYTNIEAPISGVVGDRMIRVGDRVQPSDKLYNVVNTKDIIANIHVPEKEVGKIKRGQPAFVTSENLIEQRFYGTVKHVSPIVDPQTGTFKVTIKINNKKDALRPGMFINVHVITDIHKNATLVPKTAVVYENETMNIFVVRDGVAEKVRVKPGLQDYDYVELLNDNVRPGDNVIVVGKSGLKDKTKVRIVSER